MSLYVNGYLTKAKKFEVSASEGKNGIILEINVYDAIKLELTPEQWKEVISKLTPLLKGGAGKPAPRADDDY